MLVKRRLVVRRQACDRKAQTNLPGNQIEGKHPADVESDETPVKGHAPASGFPPVDIHDGIRQPTKAAKARFRVRVHRLNAGSCHLGIVPINPFGPLRRLSEAFNLVRRDGLVLAGECETGLSDLPDSMRERADKAGPPESLVRPADPVFVYGLAPAGK